VRKQAGAKKLGQPTRGKEKEGEKKE